MLTALLPPAILLPLPARPSPLPGTAGSPALPGLQPWSCPAASNVEVLASDGPLLRAPLQPSDDPRASIEQPAADLAQLPDYRQRLATTSLGHPILEHWCVWVEPPSGGAASAPWENRWQSAVEAALAHWQTLLPIQLVQDPSAAQVRLWRRRPPLMQGPDGRRRASHGRATLTLQRVRRADVSRLEPSVEVLLSPGQRQPAIQATALHELGHAFGLWGHSDDPADAMAAVPGAKPVLVLSRRDRATLAWLYRQPTPFGQPLAP